MDKIQLHYNAMKENAANGDTEEVIDALLHTLNGINMAFYSQEYTDKMFNILSDVVKAWGNQTDRNYDSSPIEQLFHEVVLAAAERIEEDKGL